LDKILIVLVVILIPVAFYIWRKQRKKSLREKLFKKEFPAEWEKLLNDNVALYRRLPPDLKKQLHGHINIFLSEKTFEGCSGQAITDEIKLTIAALACVLLLNRKTDYYPWLISILLYPDAYFVNKDYQIGGQVLKGREVNLGESWENGAVVLSWNKIKNESPDEKSEDSLVIHEFAHQLDAEDGFVNGLPELGKNSSYEKWAGVLRREYEELRIDAVNGEDDVIDGYGAENPAEFFAVASESFFLKSCEIRKMHPELYQELCKFYNLDPAEWGRAD
jgi:Mlc titration factor MtfA (ptsG expression regulator)